MTPASCAWVNSAAILGELWILGQQRLDLLAQRALPARAARAAGDLLRGRLGVRPLGDLAA